ncbi:hypothetical protein MKEN_00540800 [Mycena kentingensis (nom. inval.)]|nr:hypothetical protein MKEN_00540800 [Mycena kentingensis (nom. inval.)]
MDILDAAMRHIRSEHAASRSSSPSTVTYATLSERQLQCALDELAFTTAPTSATPEPMRRPTIRIPSARALSQLSKAKADAESDELSSAINALAVQELHPASQTKPLTSDASSLANVFAGLDVGSSSGHIPKQSPPVQRITRCDARNFLAEFELIPQAVRSTTARDEEYSPLRPDLGLRATACKNPEKRKRLVAPRPAAGEPSASPRRPAPYNRESRPRIRRATAAQILGEEEFAQPRRILSSARPLVSESSADPFGVKNLIDALPAPIPSPPAVPAPPASVAETPSPLRLGLLAKYIPAGTVVRPPTYTQPGVWATRTVPVPAPAPTSPPVMEQPAQIVVSLPAPPTVSFPQPAPSPPPPQPPQVAVPLPPPPVVPVSQPAPPPALPQPTAAPADSVATASDMEEIEVEDVCMLPAEAYYDVEMFPVPVPFSELLENRPCPQVAPAPTPAPAIAAYTNTGFAAYAKTSAWPAAPSALVIPAPEEPAVVCPQSGPQAPLPLPLPLPIPACACCASTSCLVPICTACLVPAPVPAPPPPPPPPVSLLFGPDYVLPARPRPRTLALSQASGWSTMFPDIPPPPSAKQRRDWERMKRGLGCTSTSTNKKFTSQPAQQRPQESESERRLKAQMREIGRKVKEEANYTRPSWSRAPAVPPPTSTSSSSSPASTSSSLPLSTRPSRDRRRSSHWHPYARRPSSSTTSPTSSNGAGSSWSVPTTSDKLKPVVPTSSAPLGLVGALSSVLSVFGIDLRFWS